MPMLASARFGLPFLAAGQAQKELTHNEALASIDAVLGAAVEAAELNDPPLSPAAGQCWIVGAGPTGDWIGQAGALACWTESGWRFVPAVEGLRVWVKDQQLWAMRDAGGWAFGEERAARFFAEGQQVVGAREPGVASPAGGSIVDAEARAAIDAILARLASHGLIEP